MNATAQTIANRLSLRAPQREALEILATLCEFLPLRKGTDVTRALADVQAAGFPAVTDFERDFPSLCFALATGVGKTRLMGAFIAYLFRARGIRNYFVLAPNLTIYHKLIADFTPNTPKYVFQGLAEFAVTPPELITGETYESGHGIRGRTLFGEDAVHVNIFNVSKITSTETPKGAIKSNVPRFRRLKECLGESYFEHLASLDDLVLLMDESHRYRASGGLKAIAELAPVLGLELTATPQVERGATPVLFRNVAYSYPLSSAMADGFVKEPAVATRENFDPSAYDEAELERIKLEDGVRIHEETKVALEVYARDHDQPIVKPFLLAIARDTDHANALVRRIEDSAFFEGRYRGTVITVHSKLKGEEADETVEQLMTVEHPENPTEIVVHVNMLKEGWDVTNLYTIVPLRAANSRTLVEQSIGRGLRLPYGARTGVGPVDRLTIVAHDRFQEIVDYANSPDSLIRGGLQVVYAPKERSRVVVAEPELKYRIAGTARERRVVQTTLDLIQQEYERLPHPARLLQPEVRAEIVEKVTRRVAEPQAGLEGVAEMVDVAAAVDQAIALRNEMSIDIPLIALQPVGSTLRRYREFALDLADVRPLPVANEILIQELHHHEQHHLAGSDALTEGSLEDALVRSLMQFDDIPYDDHAVLLYRLAGQVVAHLRSYLHDADALRNVVQHHRQPLARVIHGQMQAHVEEQAAATEARVIRGFTTLRSSTFAAPADEAVRDFRVPLEHKQDIRRMHFGGFGRCLIRIQQFDSDPERRFAVMLENDRDVLKWLRPPRDQLRVACPGGGSYEPDFVVETATGKYVCEVKDAAELRDPDVQAKAAAARAWCALATDHECAHGGKPWTYLLIPDDVIADNMTLRGLAAAPRL